MEEDVSEEKTSEGEEKKSGKDEDYIHAMFQSVLPAM